MGLKESGLRGSLRNVSVEIAAIPDSVVENFESGDLNDYVGETEEFEVNQNTPVFIAENSLKTPGSSADIVSTSGKEKYPEQGDRFSQRVHYNGGSGRTNMVFAVQDIDNYYLVQVTSGGEITIFIQNSGDFTTISEKSVQELPNDEWLEFEVVWLTDGTINFEIFGASDENDNKGSSLAQLSVNDDTYSDGGIGWRNNNDGTFAYDYYAIWESGI